MPREHGESGEFVETTTLESVRDVFDAVEGPVVLSADVADRLGCTRETARRKLQQLYERGDLDRRKVARRVIYWRRERDGESGRERSVTPSEPPADRSDPAPDPADDTPESTEVSPAVSDVVDDVADGWTDDADRLAARKNAARAVLQHALDTGDPIGKSDALEIFYDEYAVEGQNDETWWRKNVRPVLRAVGEYSQGAHGYVVEGLDGAV